MGVGGHRHALAALPTGKHPVPILREASWAPGLFWTGAENLVPHRDSMRRTIQSVASRYVMQLK